VPAGKDRDAVALLDHAAHDLRGETSVVEVRPDDVLHREAEHVEVSRGAQVHRLEDLEHRAARVPRRVLRAVHDVVAHERADGQKAHLGEAQLGRERLELRADRLVDLRVEVDEVHLVDGDHEVRDPQHRRDERVAPRLLQHAQAGVDEDDGQVRRRRTGGHVPRVLDVAWGVGDDEFARRGREVPVGHVDGDALLALGPEPVRDAREVQHARAPALGRVGEVVVVDRVRVDQEPPDQRGLPVVHRADRDEAQQILLLVALEEREDVGVEHIRVGHQKYPSRFFFSIEPSSSESMRRP
jgi:hypothetical protein